MSYHLPTPILQFFGNSKVLYIFVFPLFKLPLGDHNNEIARQWSTGWGMFLGYGIINRRVDWFEFVVNVRVAAKLTIWGFQLNNGRPLCLATIPSSPRSACRFYPKTYIAYVLLQMWITKCGSLGLNSLFRNFCFICLYFVSREQASRFIKYFLKDNYGFHWV